MLIKILYSVSDLKTSTTRYSSKNAVDGENVVSVKVEVIEPLGSETLIHAEVGDGKFVATVLPETGGKTRYEDGPCI